MTARKPCGAPGAPLAPTWVVVMFSGSAVVIVPWVVWLSASLPSAQVAVHYRLAWMGFDVALIAAMAAIAATAFRGSLRRERFATAAGVLLTVDTWFDVMTSNGRGQSLEAILLAVTVELPLAMLCLWIANHASAVRERCGELRRRRGNRMSNTGC